MITMQTAPVNTAGAEGGRMIIVLSQDKTILGDFGVFSCCSEFKRGKNKVIGFATGDSREGFALGTYATRERCIEVIDEIHSMMTWPEQNPFEMPKE